MVFCLKVLLLALINAKCFALKIKYFDVPPVAENAKPVVLHCDYDLEGKDLKCVKFLKDYMEFYRYCPGHSPPARQYETKGVYQDVDRSNATHVYLSRVDIHSDGVFVCQVSTKAPSFARVRSERLMRVYILPQQSVSITGFTDNYQINDTIDVTCVSGYGRPLPYLNWFINDYMALGHQLVIHPAKVDSGLQNNELGLRFKLLPEFFYNGIVKLTCKSTIGMLDEFETTTWIINGAQVKTGSFSTYWSARQPDNREPPKIIGVRRQYRVNEVLNINCISAAKDARLIWSIDDRPVRRDSLILYDNGNSGHTMLGLHLVMEEHHIKPQGIKIKCLALIPRTISEEQTSVEVRLKEPNLVDLPSSTITYSSIENAEKENTSNEEVFTNDDSIGNEIDVSDEVQTISPRDANNEIFGFNQPIVNTEASDQDTITPDKSTAKEFGPESKPSNDTESINDDINSEITQTPELVITTQNKVEEESHQNEHIVSSAAIVVNIEGEVIPIELSTVTEASIKDSEQSSATNIPITATDGIEVESVSSDDIESSFSDITTEKIESQNSEIPDETVATNTEDINTPIELSSVTVVSMLVSEESSTSSIPMITSDGIEVESVTTSDIGTSISNIMADTTTSQDSEPIPSDEFVLQSTTSSTVSNSEDFESEFPDVTVATNTEDEVIPIESSTFTEASMLASEETSTTSIPIVTSDGNEVESITSVDIGHTISDLIDDTTPSQDSEPMTSDGFLSQSSTVSDSEDSKSEIPDVTVATNTEEKVIPIESSTLTEVSKLVSDETSAASTPMITSNVNEVESITSVDIGRTISDLIDDTTPSQDPEPITSDEFVSQSSDSSTVSSLIKDSFEISDPSQGSSISSEEQVLADEPPTLPLITPEDLIAQEIGSEVQGTHLIDIESTVDGINIDITQTSESVIVTQSTNSGAPEDEEVFSTSTTYNTEREEQQMSTEPPMISDVILNDGLDETSIEHVTPVAMTNPMQNRANYKCASFILISVVASYNLIFVRASS